MLYKNNVMKNIVYVFDGPNNLNMSWNIDMNQE